MAYYWGSTPESIIQQEQFDRSMFERSRQQEFANQMALAEAMDARRNRAMGLRTQASEAAADRQNRYNIAIADAMQKRQVAQDRSLYGQEQLALTRSAQRARGLENALQRAAATIEESEGNIELPQLRQYFPEIPEQQFGQLAGLLDQTRKARIEKMELAKDAAAALNEPLTLSEQLRLMEEKEIAPARKSAQGWLKGKEKAALEELNLKRTSLAEQLLTAKERANVLAKDREVRSLLRMGPDGRYYSRYENMTEGRPQVRAEFKLPFDPGNDPMKQDFAMRLKAHFDQTGSMPDVNTYKKLAEISRRASGQ